MNDMFMSQDSHILTLQMRVIQE